MAHKLKLNQRGEYKTWRVTSTLTPTDQINADIHWIATNNIAAVDPHILLVKACIRQKIMNPAKPESVTFISWRFLRADAASWVSNARRKLLLSDLKGRRPSKNTTVSTYYTISNFHPPLYPLTFPMWASHNLNPNCCDLKPDLRRPGNRSDAFYSASS